MSADTASPAYSGKLENFGKSDGAKLEHMMDDYNLAFCASTGRTATMFIASTLNDLPGVVSLHEGHVPGDPPTQLLPLINLQNRKAWHDSEYADQVVTELRNVATLSAAVGDAKLLVDVAFYNSPLLSAFLRHYPESNYFAVFRRCEGFVRSATILCGEDRQPAGWPGRDKALTEREKFIAMGRLQPRRGSDAAIMWPKWSAVQRNIWLWYTVNSQLLDVVASSDQCHTLLYEHLVNDPTTFWADFLGKLDLSSAPNLAKCVDGSATKLNQRPSYQIGPIETWNDAEFALYDQLARPLERKIYG